jgi:NAD(P)H-hydrate epimerase
LVVDADALNLLAVMPQRRGNWVLTPHPGEAARLLGWTVAAVQADRLAAVDELATRYDATVVLKGLADPGHRPGQQTGERVPAG